MAEYRVYQLDGAGHIIRGHDIICDTDEAAVVQAGLLGIREAYEIWSGQRLIASIPSVYSRSSSHGSGQQP